MKITENLPRYLGQRVFLVVLGKQVAKIYLIFDGQIQELEGSKVETPKYSDRESFFQRSGRGQVLGTGSVYENQDEYIINTFSIQVASHLKKLIQQNSPDFMYFFMPAHLKGSVKSKMNQIDINLIKHEFYGNYVDFHPFTLLAMIKENEFQEMAEKKVEPISEKAKQILEKKELLDESEPSS